MSEPLRGAAGVYGKIPARGDFIRIGLPRSFVDAWDGWLQNMLAASRAALGEDWLPAWLEAPVWRFALAPGVAGADAAIGLWMPSVDQVGRYFPLTLAAILSDPPAPPYEAGGFLDAAERAGREALSADLSPQELGARIAAALAEPAADPGVAADAFPTSGSLWWTSGAPHRPAHAFATGGLPATAAFLAMLDARQGVPA